jgi:hypothetical protein
VNPAASSKRTSKEDKGKSSLGIRGEDHGRCVELGTTLKNPSGYGERHVKKVIKGTGETLLYPCN